MAILQVPALQRSNNQVVGIPFDSSASPEPVVESNLRLKVEQGKDLRNRLKLQLFQIKK